MSTGDDYFEALYQTAEEDGVRCGLCPHACLVRPGKRGKCEVRQNLDGILYSLNMNRAIALNHDPVEKKPFFHVLPASVTTSVAAAGCNLRCAHCQNHDISQYPRRFGDIPGRPLSARQVVEQARAARAQTIAFTYTEPTIFYEWALAIAQAAQRDKIRCLSVSNGYISEEPLRRLAPYLMAVNVDLKAFSESFYEDVCKASLAPVMHTIELLRELGVWVEVTTLLISGLNDSDRELGQMAQFLAGIDPDMPWHLSRFHPDNELGHLPPTPVETIKRARELGRAAGLNHVYSGNVWGDEGEHTLCPGCQTQLISRYGFSVQSKRLDAGRCPNCQRAIAGIWV